MEMSLIYTRLKRHAPAEVDREKGVAETHYPWRHAPYTKWIEEAHRGHMPTRGP